MKLLFFLTFSTRNIPHTNIKIKEEWNTKLEFALTSVSQVIFSLRRIIIRSFNSCYVRHLFAVRLSFIKFSVKMFEG